MITLKIYVLRLLGFNSNFIMDTFIQTTLVDSKIKIQNKSNSLFFPSFTLYETHIIELAHSLLKVTYTLNKLQESRIFHKFISSLEQKPKLMIEFLLNDILSFNYNESFYYQPKQLFRSINYNKPNFNFSNKTTNTTLHTLNNLSKNLFMFTLSNLNIYKNLTQSKQNR
jgi:hypothetical protein